MSTHEHDLPPAVPPVTRHRQPDGTYLIRRDGIAIGSVLPGKLWLAEDGSGAHLGLFDTLQEAVDRLVERENRRIRAAWRLMEDL